MLTDEQRRERQAGIGGSDAPAIAGVDPYRTELDVYLEKIGDVQPEPPITPEDPRYWGNQLEAPIAEAWAFETGHAIQRRRLPRVSKKYPWLRGNIDRWVVGANEGLEIKNRGIFRASEYGPSGSDEVLESDILQCTHYMIVYDVKIWNMGVLLGGSDFRTYRIRLNERLAEDYIDLSREFWHHVETEDPPNPVRYEDAVKVWRGSMGLTVMADADTLEKVQQLRHVKARMKALGIEEDRIKAEIGSFMRDATDLIDPETGKTLLTWRPQTSSRLDTTAIRERLPQVAEKFTKTTETRVMRLKAEISK